MIEKFVPDQDDDDPKNRNRRRIVRLVDGVVAGDESRDVVAAAL